MRQPYNRRDELMELADRMPNISAKHEGGDPEIEQTHEHPSERIAIISAYGIAYAR